MTRLGLKRVCPTGAVASFPSPIGAEGGVCPFDRDDTAVDIYDIYVYNTSLAEEGATKPAGAQEEWKRNTFFDSKIFVVSHHVDMPSLHQRVSSERHLTYYWTLVFFLFTFISIARRAPSATRGILPEEY